MTDTTAAFYDVTSFDGRILSFGACRRVIRLIGGSVAMGLGAVAAVCVLVTGVTLAAAWIVNITLATNPQLAVKATTGPGTLALANGDPTLAGAERPREYANNRPWPPRPLDISREIARDRVSTQVAKLQPAPRIHALAPKPERADSVPLPRPHPAQLDLARAPAEQVAPKVEPRVEAKLAPKVTPQVAPQVAAVTPPAPPAAPAEKRVAPREAHNKSMALPGPDSRTAVYDIAARTVYLPNGDKLEAHSGLGDKLDDPRYVNVRMRGPTPPNVYELTLREQLFHGVRAIRLNPVDDSKMFGRDGMLAHTYMLGPNGQSNGCVSFKDYSKFLNAFLNGEVDRLVVVPQLGDTSWRTARARRGPVRRYASTSPTDEPSALTW